MSFFVKDLQRDNNIEDFLDKNFYEKRFSIFKRASREDQLNGVDIFCHWDNLREIAIDEKYCRCSYSNQCIAERLVYFLLIGSLK